MKLFSARVRNLTRGRFLTKILYSSGEKDVMGTISNLQDEIRLLLAKRDKGSLDLIDKNLKLSIAADSDKNIGESYVSYALYYSIVDLNYEQFRAYLEKARPFFDLEDHRRAAYFYGNIASCYQCHSMLPETQSFFLKAISAMEQLADRSVLEIRRLASYYYNLYILFGFSDFGTLEKRYIDRALELNSSISNKLGMSYNYSAIVSDLDKQGKIEEALKYAIKRIELAETLNDPYQLGLSYSSAGLLYAKLKNKTASNSYFGKAEKLLFPNSHPEFQAGYYFELADAQIAFELYDDSIKNYKNALELYSLTQSSLNLSTIYRQLSGAYKHLGKYIDALLYQEKYSQSLLDNFKLDKLLAVTAAEHEYEQKQHKMETAMLRQKNDEISIYVKQLEQSNDDLKQFAHAASHDLREPVRAIVSYASLLEMSLREKLDPEEREYLLYLKEGGRRMYDMVTGILAFSKVHNSQDVTDVDLNIVYHEVLENIKLAITSKSAYIECADLPVVRGNSTLLIQLFQNLISNGIKYNESETPTIKISCERKGDVYQFCVSDNGIGIEEKHKTEVFDIFTRLHNQEQYQGTGIGLSICRKIVERLGGQIWNQPNETGGTDFIFTLPASI